MVNWQFIKPVLEMTLPIKQSILRITYRLGVLLGSSKLSRKPQSWTTSEYILYPSWERVTVTLQPKGMNITFLLVILKMTVTFLMWTIWHKGRVKTTDRSSKTQRKNDDMLQKASHFYWFVWRRILCRRVFNKIYLPNPTGWIELWPWLGVNPDWVDPLL